MKLLIIGILVSASLSASSISAHGTVLCVGSPSIFLESSESGPSSASVSNQCSLTDDEHHYYSDGNFGGGGNLFTGGGAVGMFNSGLSDGRSTFDLIVDGVYVVNGGPGTATIAFHLDQDLIAAPGYYDLQCRFGVDGTLSACPSQTYSTSHFDVASGVPFEFRFEYSIQLWPWLNGSTDIFSYSLYPDTCPGQGQCSMSAIPEPSTAALTTSGLLLLMGVTHRRHRRI